jgi:hypothetical protein
LLEGPPPLPGERQLPMDHPGFSCDHPFQQTLLVGQTNVEQKR